MLDEYKADDLDLNGSWSPRLRAEPVYLCLICAMSFNTYEQLVRHAEDHDHKQKRELARTKAQK